MAQLSPEQILGQFGKQIELELLRIQIHQKPDDDDDEVDAEIK